MRPDDTEASVRWFGCQGPVTHSHHLTCLFGSFNMCLFGLSAVPTHYHDLDVPFSSEAFVSAFKNDLVCTVSYIHK